MFYFFADRSLASENIKINKEKANELMQFELKRIKDNSHSQL